MAKRTTPAPAVAVAPAAPKPNVAPAPRQTLSASKLVQHPRAQWAKAGPIQGKVDPMGRPTCITIHHEGDMAEHTSVQCVALHLEDVRKVHTKDRGFGDIGYHFLIDYNGEIWEGRPLNLQGAHAGNDAANAGNIGICLLGDFNQQKPTAAQKAALQQITWQLMAQYGIATNRVYTHQEVKRKFGLSPTDCPGTALQAYVDAMRNSWRTASR